MTFRNISYRDIPLFPSEDEQRKIIEAKMMGTDPAIFEIQKSERIQFYRNTQQQFAVFGSRAIDISVREDFYDDLIYCSRPAILDGCAIFRSSGIEYVDSGILVFWTGAYENKSFMDKWNLDFHPARWIYTRELEKSAEEIEIALFEEVQCGETPLTGANDLPRN
ncbi:hypothetical protein OL397_004459 [Salmonella enterica]|nr:hypothetical protein [Salmonella enterica]